jgi:hypothetical protein
VECGIRKASPIRGFGITPGFVGRPVAKERHCFGLGASRMGKPSCPSFAQPMRGTGLEGRSVALIPKPVAEALRPIGAVLAVGKVRQLRRELRQDRQVESLGRLAALELDPPAFDVLPSKMDRVLARRAGGKQQLEGETGLVSRHLRNRFSSDSVQV